jgi:hypothetical protein
VAVDGTLVMVSNETHTLTGQITVTKGAHIKSTDGPERAIIERSLPASTGRCMYISHSNAVVEGFTMRNAGFMYRYSTGGAVHVHLGGTLSNCHFYGNVAGRGGAVFMYKGGGIAGCVFTNNTALDYGLGAGIAADAGGSIKDSRFMSNHADTGGGGIYGSPTLISNCIACGNSTSGRGGGIWTLYGNRFGTLIVDCVVSNNTADDMGAGMNCQDNTILRCHVTDNRGTDEYANGGGINVGNCIVTDCIVTSNSANYAAGVDAMDAQLRNCVITHNRALGPKFPRAGGLESLRSDVRNCLIAHNASVDIAGGVYLYGGTFYLGRDPMFINNTVVSNHAASQGGGVYCPEGPTGVTLNCVIYHNDAPEGTNWYQESTNWEIRASCTYPLVDGPGNISNSPAFVSVAGDDWRLDVGSPCINVGENKDWMYDSFDLAGLPRILYNVVDMGAYEHADALWCTFSAAPTQTMVEAPVAFGSTAGGTNTQGLYYRWDFDNDGVFDLEGPLSNAPAWAYGTTGLYSVALLLSNAVGETASLVRPDYIYVYGDTPGTPPDPPTGLAASDGDYTTMVRVMWNAQSNATKYALYRNTTNSSQTAVNIAPDITAVTHDDTAVSQGAMYYYWAKAGNDFGWSDFSAVDAGYANIDAPTGVTASQGTWPNGVAVMWQNVAGANVFIILRAPTNAPAQAAEVGTAAATSFEDAAADPAVPYWYWVRAATALVTSDFSNAALGFMRSTHDERDLEKWKLKTKPDKLKAGIKAKNALVVGGFLAQGCVIGVCDDSGTNVVDGPRTLQTKVKKKTGEIKLYFLKLKKDAIIKYKPKNGKLSYKVWGVAVPQDAMVFLQPDVGNTAVGRVERLETRLTPTAHTTGQGWMVMRHQHRETNSVPLPAATPAPARTP